MSSTHDKGLGKEAPYCHTIQIVFPILFLIIWTLDTFLLNFSTFLNLYVPFILRIFLFIILLILSLIVIYIAHETLFKKPHHEGEIITTGIFARVRNPLYLGELLFYIPFLILSISIISLVFWIIIIIIFDRMATYEEKELEILLGEKYLKYKKLVHKWIPT